MRPAFPFIVRALLLTAAVTVAASGRPVFARQIAPVQGQVDGRPAARLSAAERTTALAAIKAQVEKSYVFPEKRTAIVDRLSQAQQAGRYELDDPAQLAERITDDLREASHDRHLYLLYQPDRYAAVMRPAGSADDETAFVRRQAIHDHHGLAEQRILSGNIRYLRITGFEWVTDETGAAYDDAMRFLKDGDAVIIDLRGNGGGSGAATQYLISHFLPADTLMLTFLRGSDVPAQSRSLQHLPAGRMVGKPLYVLIDGGVGSAAEEVAYNVQQFKLGELVGATTAGAANNNPFYPIAPGFMFSVSEGRPVHAVSNTNWEGVGVAPSVEAAPAQALEVAQSLALTRLAKAPTVTPDQRAEYAWARVGVETRLHPVSLTAKQLQAMAGRFGEITVALRDGALWMTRADRPARHLVPMTADGLFAIEGNDMLRVRITEKRLELSRWDDPEPRVFARN